MRKQQMWDVMVLGAGASGIMAAITAARHGARVLLLEQKEKIGKKILATGNGKCNFTNAKMELSAFRGNQSMAEQILSQFGLAETLEFFHGIGILPKCRNGYYYPNSQTASALRQALETELVHSGVEIRTGVKVRKIRKKADGGYVHFELDCPGERFCGEKLICSVGLLASPKLGSDGSAFPLIRELGHQFTRIVPALCGFYAKGLNFKKVAGVRTDATVTVYIEKQEIFQDTGELQMTDYGISGIPVFQISRYVSMALAEKYPVEIAIDFFPELSPQELETEITGRFQASGEVITRMNGLLHEKLLPVLLSQAGISEHDFTDTVPEKKIQKFCNICKGCIVTPAAPREFDFAQICAGGIRPEEVEENTLESKIVPGLYFTGEILDVDGICGGYNLQWAWSSGYVAGRNAATKDV